MFNFIDPNSLRTEQKDEKMNKATRRFLSIVTLSGLIIVAGAIVAMLGISQSRLGEQPTQQQQIEQRQFEEQAAKPPTKQELEQRLYKLQHEVKVFERLIEKTVEPTSHKTYKEAQKESIATGKPMLILVSATWCGPCKRMKSEVIPKVDLSEVIFTVIDIDAQSDLARKLTGGGPVPQLVMYRQVGDDWMKKKKIGFQSVSAVEQFISGSK